MAQHIPIHTQPAADGQSALQRFNPYIYPAGRVADWIRAFLPLIQQFRQMIDYSGQAPQEQPLIVVGEAGVGKRPGGGAGPCVSFMGEVPAAL